MSSWSTLVWVCGFLWLGSTGWASAQSTVQASPPARAPADGKQPAASAAPSQPPAASWPPLTTLPEPGTTFRLDAPPPVGACIGGSCVPPSAAPLTFGAFEIGAQPAGASFADAEEERANKPNAERRARFAMTGAALGVTTAALALGGSIAIATIDDRSHERITRGVWLGTVALSTPLIALSAYVARKVGTSSGHRGVRRIGWTAYTLAVADGALLWAGSFADFDRSPLLTIGAGALGAIGLLLHGLDAYSASRAIRAQRFLPHVSASASRLMVRF